MRPLPYLVGLALLVTPPAWAQPQPAEYDPALVTRLVAEARAQGDARRGAEVFRSPTAACLNCHKVGKTGGGVGPELTRVRQCLTPEQIVESVLWPKRQVKDEYKAVAVFLDNGQSHTGYKVREDDKELVLRDPAKEVTLRFPRARIEDRREIGTLMPDGLANALSPQQLRDLLRFLFELGAPGGAAVDALLVHSHTPASFPFDRLPLHPEQWPNRDHPVNRDRLYDFYTKEAAYFQKQASVQMLLPEFPGLDGGKYGHWGNQNEATWADGRWNQTDLGTLLCGVFRGAGVTVPKGVCIRLGEHGELAACFNPQSLCYEAVWKDGFVKFSAVRHGFMDGLILDGKPLPRAAGQKPAAPFVYHGFYRHGKRVIFSYRVGDEEMLDAPWAENGQFVRVVGPAREHPLARLTRGGPKQWPQVFEVRGTLGTGNTPYLVDTIPPPFDNPWKAPLFFGGHDFLPDGTALLCTMQGDVWRVEGLNKGLEHVRWRRVASGLHQALGLVVAEGQVYVLGRDQITRLHDLNGDGEADFYECFSNAYDTSSAGHDFICGLERDGQGRFYTASGKQGLLRISADGHKVEVLATGMRNPDGLGLLPDGTVTVPCSEGEWTCASMVCAFQPGGRTPFFGYGGPKNGRPPDLPMLYLPRGLDNSSGGQVPVTSDRWGTSQGQIVHLSYGSGTHFLVLTDKINGQIQAAAVPLSGDFRAGVHRGRFSPKDGQLYVSGMGGWGTYTPDDGCFQRVRYTGRPAQLPVAWHAFENGVRLTFSQPLDRTVAELARNHFVQAWNYRYGRSYGSPEFSPRHPTTPGHDSFAVASAHVLADGRSLFLELPDLQPINQLHLHVQPDAGTALDVFATVHRLDGPFADFPGYRPAPKTIAAHPILADLARMVPAVPNPWRRKIAGAREITIEAGKNLTFSKSSLTVRAGEPIRLVFRNPDVVPHNWVLVRPGTLPHVGDLANRLVAEPDAATRHYVPRTSEVLVNTDVVGPGEEFSIFFRAPQEKGRYPYLCTFPGHWMVMNGQMVVE